MLEPRKIDPQNLRTDMQLRALIREIVLELLVAGNINSEAATVGQVLTADGAGAATWETP